MRLPYLAIAVYVAASLAWIYGPMSRNAEASLWWLPALILLHVGLGFVVGQWWSCVIPPMLIVAAVPAGYGDGGDIPVWVAVALLALIFAMPLVILGVAVRRVGGDFLRRSIERPGSPSALGNAPDAASRKSAPHS
jgi:hypothetical protein